MATRIVTDAVHLAGWVSSWCCGWLYANSGVPITWISASRSAGAGAGAGVNNATKTAVTANVT
jgi:hypothetical protein